MDYIPQTICPACGVADPDIVTVDFGIGAYEYWGARGFHTDEHLVTRCCEAEPTQFLFDPMESENLIPEDLVSQ